MAFAEHPVQRQALHQAGSHLGLLGGQRQLDGFVNEAVLAQQPAGIQAQALEFCRGKFPLQGQRHRWQQTMPLPVPAQRLEERRGLQKTTQQRARIALRPQPCAEPDRHPWQVGDAQQQLALVFGQERQQLAAQVLAHPGSPCPLIAALCAQQQAHACAPALGL
ncbi:hypothetical protein D3C77_441810 [compost metagenome]